MSTPDCLCCGASFQLIDDVKELKDQNSMLKERVKELEDQLMGDFKSSIDLSHKELSDKLT